MGENATYPARVARLERTLKKELFDAEGESVRRRAKDYFGLDISSIRVIHVLTIDSKLTKEQLEKAREEIFTNPVTEVSSFQPLANEFDWVIWVGYRPGVRDTQGSTAVEAIEDLLKTKFEKDEAVYTSKIYLVNGNLKKEEAEKISREMLANDLIQQWKVIKKDDWNPEEGIGIIIPKVILKHEPTTTTLPIKSDEGLAKLSDERNLSLNPADIPTIREYFLRPDVIEGRKNFSLSDPTDIELEYIAQARSDHCNHNTFNGKFHYKDLETGEEKVIGNLFKECIKRPTEEIAGKRDWVVSILWDNAGVGRFDPDTNYCITGETHNSPTNMEAYGGAITGNVGIFRDIMGTGKGAKVVLGTYYYCVGPRDYSGGLKPRLHPRRLLDGAISGVKDGGNASGIPTPFGGVFFDESYLGKCLLFVTTMGAMPSKINEGPTHEKKTEPGDLLIMCGGRVGKDGIHGVTASSAEYSEHTPAGHVQIGDPYTQKKMHDFLLEVRDEALIEFITDNGGGGLSSSIGESARFSNGAEVNLEKVPLKYQGLDPWEIWVSESQERMTLAIKPENEKQFFELAKKHDVLCTVIGKYTDTGKLHIKYDDKTIAYVDLSLLKSGFPQWEFEAEWTAPASRGLSEPQLQEPEDHNTLINKMLSRPNIASREWIQRQYDHEVQGGSVVKPFVGIGRDVPSDAIVQRPLLDNTRGLALTQALNPTYGKIDAYWMTKAVIDESIRRLIAVGGNLEHIGGVDNFCWPNIQHDSETNPDGKLKAAHLVRSCTALKESCVELGIPLLSGKDSMYIDGNLEGEDGKKHKVSGLPTLMFTACSVADDSRKCVTMGAKNPGDLVYVIGETKDELGGSEYYEMLGHVGLNVPKTDFKELVPSYKALQRAISLDLVKSAHGIYRGGLGVHLAQVAFAGGLGMGIDLGKIPTELKQDSKILFSESTGRFIITISPEDKGKFEAIFTGTKLACVGTVTQNPELIINGLSGDVIIKKQAKELKEAWQAPFKNL